MDNSIRSYPVNTIKRIPVYLRLIKAMQRDGKEFVSSALIADKLGLDSIQVRKDIQITGIVGKPKVGYYITERR